MFNNRENLLARIFRRWMGVAQEETQQEVEALQQQLGQYANDLLKGVLDPTKLLEFIRSMGMDPSRLAGMVGQQPGFDPYQILHLDRSASDEEVKKRYHELLHKLHPDTAGVEGTEFLLQMVLAAYEMIKRQRGW